MIFALRTASCYLDVSYLESAPTAKQTSIFSIYVNWVEIMGIDINFVDLQWGNNKINGNAV